MVTIRQPRVTFHAGREFVLSRFKPLQSRLGELFPRAIYVERHLLLGEPWEECLSA
jgi:hypothetical protein